MNEYTTSEPTQEIPYGYCHCGCGGKTKIAKITSRSAGYKKGAPRRYIYTHHKPVDRMSLFMNKVSKDDASQCWLWTGCQNGSGYGYFKYQEREQLAHRVSYQLFKGLIPKGLLVCHTCDRKECVNPNHLFLGTCMDNMTDCISKKRKPVGESCTNAKLTENQVLEMRARYASGSITQEVLASEFGIARQTVSDIIHGKRWKHLPLTTQ